MLRSTSRAHATSGKGRTGVNLMVAFALLVLGLILPAAPAVAVSYGGAVSASWPASFSNYTYANGAVIGDTNGDMNPSYLDIASGACSGCAGPASSVLLTSDGTNAFFRVRLGTDLSDTSKGGLFGGAFLTQIAVRGVVKAIVGVDGKNSSNDYVYVADSVGGVVNKVYEYPWTGNAAGVRVISTGDGTGQFFLDYQVPISVITTVSGGAITSSTAIQLYYGSSAAANLATINKDFMLGDVTAVDFSNLATVRFVPLTYVVAFDSAGGTAVASQTVTENTKATSPSPPTRAGYTFDGWYTSAVGGTQWDFNTLVTGATTLYAHWSRVTYAVAFDSAGGTAVASQTINEGESATAPPAPTRTGYTFDGWFTAATGGSAWNFTDPVTAATTLYAQWTVNSYSVVFDSDGGSAVSSQDVDYNASATEPATPTRAGYTFLGWFTAASGGSAWNFDDPITDDITLYAQWTINTYSVSFDSNGGSAVGDQTVDHGSPATEPVDPTRTGYTFDGWYDAATGGTLWDFTDPITGTTELYAQWTINTYLVSFDSNGGTAVGDQSVDYNTAATEPTPPTRAGYTFDGWFTAATGGTLWDFTDPITGTTGLFAQWTLNPPNTYTVSFDSNGGSAVDPQTIADGDQAVEPVDPTRTGYTFDGWFTAATGGTLWDFTDPITGTTTLYAQWTTVVAATYVVTFESAGGTAVGPQVVTAGEPAVEPANPTRTGFTFDGWYTTAVGGVAWDYATPITAATALYAHWTQSTYLVTFNSAGGTAVASQTVGHGNTVVEPTPPTRSGYTFRGWSATATGGSAWDFTTPVTGAVTLHAQWGQNATQAYTVSFKSHRGTTVAPQTVASGETATVPAQPKRTGYTFAGWFTASSRGEEWTFSTPVTADLTLHARWTKKVPTAQMLTVTFDSAGGSDVPGKTVIKGAAVRPPRTPVREGYTFTGWFVAGGNKVWDFADAVRADLTLVAHWSKVGPDVAGTDAEGEDGSESGAGTVLPATGTEMPWSLVPASLLMIIIGAFLVARRRRTGF